MTEKYQQLKIQQRGKVLRLLEQPSTNPSQQTAGIPKEDKILEWTMFHILEQLEAINLNLAKLSHKT